MPFYRITIWVKTKRYPITGIRFINQTNIDLATIYFEGLAKVSFPPYQVTNVEVGMLSKNNKAVRLHQTKILRKSGKLDN